LFVYFFHKDELVPHHPTRISRHFGSFPFHNAFTEIKSFLLNSTPPFLFHSARPRHYAPPLRATRPLGPGGTGGGVSGSAPAGRVVMRLSHGDACVGGPDR
jgi:hypothetical protein